jgi:thiol-disulfide isomerase/thioredoxin
VNIKTLSIVAVALAALVAGYWFGQHKQANTAENNSEQVLTSSTPARLIDFSLPDIEGKSRKLSEWQGQVIILNFWATWCPPCRDEIPMFLEFYEKLHPRGLEIIGVAIDKKEDVETYMDTMLIDYPVLMGDEATLTLMRRYGNRVGSLPYNVLINRNGKILHTKKGSYTHPELETLLKPLFKE